MVGPSCPLLVLLVVVMSCRTGAVSGEDLALGFLDTVPCFGLDAAGLLVFFLRAGTPAGGFFGTCAVALYAGCFEGSMSLPTAACFVLTNSFNATQLVGVLSVCSGILARTCCLLASLALS